MSTYTFSYYNGPITNKKPKSTISLFDAMELIRSDKYKDQVQQLRDCDNPTLKKTLKSSLPYFTFSGTFTQRKNDALKKHSGLIVLDFDDLTDDQLHSFYTDFQTIDWVCAIWISPSGNGLKVIVKINPEDHLTSFKELYDFFIGNFSIEIDASGKDVSRACFVSCDSNAYYNPNATIYETAGLKTLYDKKKRPNVIEKSDTKLTPLKIEQLLKRVEYVVQQINRDQIDITDNDYTARMSVGFALATLGERARNFYKSAVQFNEHSDDVSDDDKFTEALKNGKFKNPNKFFSLAKDSGLDTKLPRTIDQENKEIQAKATIGNSEFFEEWKKFAIYFNKEEGIYYSLNSKGTPVPITNFSLRILYHISTGADEAYRLMQIKNIYGLEKILRINTDDFVAAGSFKKIIARLGNFIFKGADSDLVRLQDMLQRHEVHTENVETLGYNKRHKFYAFANGLFDTVENEFLPIDNYGIVEKVINGKNINFFIPALSSVFRDKEDKFVNEKKFIYIQSPVKYKDWANQYVKVFGENGRVGLVFWACALFSDILFKAMGLRMPMPFSYGKRGSGKGTMTQSLTRMWGEKQDQIMLGGATTVVGFMRKMAQFSNALVWLDEYKNSLQGKTIESIKNLFDRIGYERGKKDNSFTTESTPILSAVWLSGQEMPTIEPALFTRTILLTFAETNRTEEARNEFRKLQRMEDQGLSHLTVDMLQYRDLFEKEYQGIYEATLRDFSSEINNRDIDERLFGNYSMLLATAKIMEGLQMLPFSLTDFRNQCKGLLLHQYYILKGSDDTSKFWQVIEQLVGSYIIKENDHYLLANGFIFIYIQDVYHHYVKAMNDRREMNILDKPTLENYLKSDAKTFVARVKKTIGQKYSWAFQFKYKELEIDLIRGVDKNDIKKKYADMGLEYVDEQKVGDIAEDGFPVVEQKEFNF